MGQRDVLAVHDFSALSWAKEEGRNGGISLMENC